MAKLYQRVNVAALIPFPAIRLQFEDEAYLNEPASHVDVLIASNTADQLIKCLQDARAKQEETAAVTMPLAAIDIGKHN